MKTISKQLEELSGGLLKIVNEVGDNTGRYIMFNDGGVECEVGEFLYGLVRMMKPQHILETGTHKGVGAAYMGSALKDNGSGGITTLEFLDNFVAEAGELIKKLNLTMQVNIVKADAKDYEVDHRVLLDILFLDTEPQTRFAELIKYYYKVRAGGIILIHDLHQHMHQIPNEEHGFAWPYGPLPEEIKQLIKSGELVKVHFRTPRGLTMFYKRGVDDFQC